MILSRSISMRARVTPVLTLISACVMAVAAVFLIGIFAEIAADHDVALNRWILTLIESRYWVAVTALPAAVLAIVALLSSSGATRMVLSILGALCLLGPLALIMYVGLGVIAPLYQYQPL